MGIEREPLDLEAPAQPAGPGFRFKDLGLAKIRSEHQA